MVARAQRAELVNAARGRYSEQVLQATGQVGTPVKIETAPLSIQIWRSWGAAVSRLNADGEKGM